MDLDVYTSYFSFLPAHIITQILGYLSLDDLKIASCVCKSWHYASTDPQIVKTLIIKPKEEDFPEIYKTNCRYGVLKIKKISFEQADSHYFGLFEKIGPYLYELHFDSDVQIHHLLKLLQSATSLKVFLFTVWYKFAQFPSLFPLDYDSEAKQRIVKNLSGLKHIELVQYSRIPIVADILKYTTNIETFKIIKGTMVTTDEDNFFQQFNSIFDNASSLKHLNLQFQYTGYVDDILTSFDQIKGLNLRSFRIAIPFIWKDGLYKSNLFRQFLLKLQSLVTFHINGLRQDQLSLICQYLVNLKHFNCVVLGNNQPIWELGNLKKLVKLHYNSLQQTCVTEIDHFFKCKFEYLRIFHFDEFVTEANLIQLCENHPNLHELELSHLLTRNLEIIFKYLLKLRVLTICFGFKWLARRPEISVANEPTSDVVQNFKYKITRLQELEKFRLSELVNGICADDVRQLKKLRTSNLPELFRKQAETMKDA